MSENQGQLLPPELLAKLQGGALYRPGGIGLAVLTVDEAGWPHVAMAPGAVAVRAQEVFVALGGNSHSMANVRRDGRLTLLVAAPDSLYYIKGVAELVRAEMQVMPQEAALRLKVTEVLRDVENFVTITSGIGYRYNLMHDEFVQVIGALLDELHGLAEAVNPCD